LGLVLEVAYLLQFNRWDT